MPSNNQKNVCKRVKTIKQARKRNINNIESELINEKPKKKQSQINEMKFIVRQTTIKKKNY